MKAFLNDKLDSIGKERFYIVGPITALTADVILMYYIVNIALTRMLTPQSINRWFKMLNGDHVFLTHDHLSMLIATGKMTISFMLLGFFMFHCVIGYNFYKKTKFSIGYLKYYCASTVFLSIIEMFGYIIQLGEFNYWTFITLLLYAFVDYGIIHFKMQEQQT